MFFGNIDPEILRRQRRRFRRAHAQQQVQINPRLVKWMPLLNIIPLLLMSLSYLLPYIFRSKELYVFERNKDYPYEKKTHRYKINYYVGKDFEDKYKDKSGNYFKIKGKREIGRNFNGIKENKTSCPEIILINKPVNYRTIFKIIIIMNINIVI
jgi:hypothetical protein